MSMFRVAVAQILSGSDPAGEPGTGRDADGRSRRGWRSAGGLSRGHYAPLRTAAGRDRRACGRSLGKAAAGDRRAAPARGGGRHVQSERGRPGQQHAARCRDQVSMRTTTRSTSSMHSAFVNPRQWRLAPSPW